MKEEEFDALMQGRSFGTKDAMRAETQLRRIFTLGAEVWGKTPDDLKRQLSAPHPEIRPGIELSDLQELLRRVETILAAFHDPKNAWLAPSVVALSSPTIAVGTQQFTAWEARCEIVRRAIRYLETR
jgi:hypothetical protein